MTHQFKHPQAYNKEVIEMNLPSYSYTLSNRQFMKTCFERGNAEEIHRLVAEGFDLNLVHDGTSILGELIMTGCDFEKVGKDHLKAILSPTRLAMVRLLLSLGADPNIGDTYCNSPLIWDPIIYFDIEMIRLLAEMGANLNWQDECGVTLFDSAVSDYWYDFFIATDKQRSVRRPTEDEMLNADAELSYLFDVAAQVGAPLPDHLKVLRDLGAKNGREFDLLSV